MAQKNNDSLKPAIPKGLYCLSESKPKAHSINLLFLNALTLSFVFSSSNFKDDEIQYRKVYDKISIPKEIHTPLLNNFKLIMRHQ